MSASRPWLVVANIAQSVDASWDYVVDRVIHRRCRSESEADRFYAGIDVERLIRKCAAIIRKMDGADIDSLERPTDYDRYEVEVGIWHDGDIDSNEFQNYLIEDKTMPDQKEDTDDGAGS